MCGDGSNENDSHFFSEICAVILVSNTEPQHLRNLGRVSTTPENYGCDLLIVSRRAKLGLQRKVFPKDLIASLEDGRLGDQLAKMGDLDRAAIVLIGYPTWTLEGELVFDSWSGRTWNFYSIMGGLATTMFEANVGHFWVRDEGEFVQLVKMLDGWNQKEKHSTLRTRSRPKAKGWGMSDKIRQAHFLQGLPGVGPELAERIVSQFGGVPLRWTVDRGQMMEVPGVGKKKAEGLGELVEYESEA